MLWRLIRRLFRILFPYIDRKPAPISDNNVKQTAPGSKTITSLEMLANQYQHTDDERAEIATVIAPTIVDQNETKKPLLEMSTTLGEPPYYDERSKWEAMRLKKHFTVQSNLMLKENETTYLGAFAVATELRTVKKSPLSCTFNNQNSPMT
jgi:hypothetical protein